METHLAIMLLKNMFKGDFASVLRENKILKVFESRRFFKKDSLF